MNDPALRLLFPEGIYLIPEKAEKDKSTLAQSSVDEKPAIKYTGNNEKEIVILYDSPSPLTADEETFLLKIMSAVGLSLNDIALVHLTSNNSSWYTLPHHTLLMFGCESLPDIPESSYVPFHREGVTLLRSDPLPQLMADKSLKSNLWQGLKKMFGV